MSESLNTGSAFDAGTPSVDSAAVQNDVGISTTGSLLNSAVSTPSVPTGEAPTGARLGDAVDSWVNNIQDENIKAYAETRNWKNIEEVIKSYQNAEKLIGADKANRGVVIPADDSDPETWNKFYEKIGRPANPEEYKLPVPEGQSPEFAKQASQWFHELGFSIKQAQGLAEKWNETLQRQAQEADAAFEAQVEADQIALRNEDWKTETEYARNVELAKRAADGFGVSPEFKAKLQRAVGEREMVKFFARIGEGFSEHFFAGGNPSPFGMSKEAAKVQLDELQNDVSWRDRYLSGGKKEKAEFERLTRIAYSR